MCPGKETNRKSRCLSMNKRLQPLLDRLVAKPLPWFLPAVAIFLYLEVFIPTFYADLLW